MPKPCTFDQRIHMRFNKVFSVVVASEIYGDIEAVARNISAGGMLVEMIEPPPLGTIVTVHFEMPDCPGEISARAAIKHHYCFNFAIGDEPASTRGIGLKFIEFLEDSDPPSSGISRGRILH